MIRSRDSYRPLTIQATDSAQHRESGVFAVTLHRDGPYDQPDWSKIMIVSKN